VCVEYIYIERNYLPYVSNFDVSDGSTVLLVHNVRLLILKTPSLHRLLLFNTNMFFLIITIIIFTHKNSLSLSLSLSLFSLFLSLLLFFNVSTPNPNPTSVMGQKRNAEDSVDKKVKRRKKRLKVESVVVDSGTDLALRAEILEMCHLRGVEKSC
jgi:hypothetical protein